MVELKALVTRSIDHIRESPLDAKGGVRWKKLAFSRAEQLFHELDDAMDFSLSEDRPAGPN